MDAGNLVLDLHSPTHASIQDQIQGALYQWITSSALLFIIIYLRQGLSKLPRCPMWPQTHDPPALAWVAGN